MARPIEEVAKEWIEIFRANEDSEGMTIHTSDECIELADMIEELMRGYDNYQNHICCCCGDCP
jgi:hypothetical protein